MTKLVKDEGSHEEIATELRRMGYSASLVKNTLGKGETDPTVICDARHHDKVVITADKKFAVEHEDDISRYDSISLDTANNIRIHNRSTSICNVSGMLETTHLRGKLHKIVGGKMGHNGVIVYKQNEARTTRGCVKVASAIDDYLSNTPDAKIKSQIKSIDLP